MTPFTVAMTTKSCQIDKTITDLAFYLDNEQVAMAAIELGRLEELAVALGGICRLSRDVLYDESQILQGEHSSE